MPQSTEKEKIINFLVRNAIDEIDFIEIMEFDDNSEYDAIDNILDELVENIIAVTPFRRGVLQKVPKPMKRSLDILTQLDDKKFLQMLGVNRTEFNTIVLLIADNTEFNRRHSCEQFPIEYQLAIVLYRLGSSGKRTSIKRISECFGVGSGGTVDKITRRIFRAILNLQSNYIFWPNAEERAKIVAETYNELPFCIGYVDAFEIPLAVTPVKNADSLVSRTHKYSIKAQVICDYKFRIRHFFVGYHGSTQKSEIFKNCDIHKQPEKYFSSHEWIAAGSAYSLSSTVITPYSKTSNIMDIKQRQQFNRKLSSYRVRVDHCCGMLKRKFKSLKNLKMRVNSPQRHLLCYQWIAVCCILHNILLNVAGAQVPEEFIQNDDDVQEQHQEQDACSIDSKLESKRQNIYNLLFN